MKSSSRTPGRMAEAAPQSTQTAGVGYTVVLDPALLGNQIAKDFLGDSVKPYRMCEFVRLSQAAPAMNRMLSNLGSGMIRFGETRWSIHTGCQMVPPRAILRTRWSTQRSSGAYSRL